MSPQAFCKLFDQNGSMWSYGTSRGRCFLNYHRPWGRLAGLDKVEDGLAVRCEYSWLVSPIGHSLTCPMYCGFFAGWHDVFCPHSQQGFYCNKRVKWSQPRWARVPTTIVAYWPACCPHVAPSIVLWSRHMLPVRCPFLLWHLLKRPQRNPLSPCQHQHQLFSSTW